ncbi:hypothetical protein GCM10008023_40390 [Sphingomonas glacialis]|uniref:CsbD family protein n=1 Tax=Sphingomonas glacialis TaxID=658225 RepID=A0ABQ3M0J7_9SPHN|nr:hypothetical protein GCM10008023_40390 [Sphingomonas glacialis]
MPGLDIFLLVPVGVRLFANRATRQDRLKPECGERGYGAEKRRSEKGEEGVPRTSVSQSPKKKRQCSTACQGARKRRQQDREVERGGAKAQAGQLSRMAGGIACQTIDAVGNPPQPCGEDIQQRGKTGQEEDRCQRELDDVRRAVDI